MIGSSFGSVLAVTGYSGLQAPSCWRPETVVRPQPPRANQPVAAREKPSQAPVVPLGALLIAQVVAPMVAQELARIIGPFLAQVIALAIALAIVLVIAQLLAPVIHALMLDHLPTPVYLLQRFLPDASLEARLRLAQNPYMPASYFEALANDPSPIVRMELTWNRGLPGNLLRQLVSDENTLVSDQASEKLYSHDRD